MTIRPLALFLLAFPLAAQTPEEIRAILVNRIDVGKKAVGMAVGTIDAKGRQIVGHGRLSKTDSRTPDGDTVFEIGSISKVFTALVLADMVERGEVKLDDPVAKYLPVRVPARNGREITLRDLSQQVSGLPRLPTNFKPADPTNPYADFDAAKLYEFLQSYALPRDPGEKYEYSNVGVGLLGHALSRRAGTSYEEMVRKRILDPLGMKRTSIKLSAEQRKNFATGHDPALNPVNNWDLDALAGAGALRSTVNDMLTFLAAHLELTDTPLKAAIRRTRAERRDTGTPDLQIALGWHILNKYGTEVIWHNGGTGGYRSWTGIVLDKKKGAVVLCNTSFDNDDFGRHLLEPQYPVAKLAAPIERKEVALDPKMLQDYVGEYDLAGTALISVSVEGGRVFAQVTGQPRFELFAEKADQFFFKVADAQLSFVRNDAGAVTSLILHQNGRDLRAARK